MIQANYPVVIDRLKRLGGKAKHRAREIQQLIGAMTTGATMTGEAMPETFTDRLCVGVDDWVAEVVALAQDVQDAANAVVSLVPEPEEETTE